MTGFILYTLVLALLVLSASKDLSKTRQALTKAWNSFAKLLPELLAIMVVVGILLAWLSPEQISLLLGSQSGLAGVVMALMLGSVALIPSFVAFPLAGALLKAGAGYPQIAAFVSTLMAVGIITLPAEIKCIGKPATVARNASALVTSIIFTLVIWQVIP